MAPINLEEENHQRDAEFNRAMHGVSAQEPSQFMAMLKKDAKAHQFSSDEYWKHWEHRKADTETEQDREVSDGRARTYDRSMLMMWLLFGAGTESAIRVVDQTVSVLHLWVSAIAFFPSALTVFDHSYYNLTTDFYEHGWASSFHFCRYNPGEGFIRALARHEHYLAHMMGLRSGMRVLDVGCGVGAPAREIACFTDVHITGLNNNDYQIDRARRYTVDAACADRVDFVKGDFMVCARESGVEIILG